MPTKTTTNVSVKVLNNIRNQASTDYRNYVPVATEDAGVLKEIGKVLMDSPNLRNEFYDTLINMIAKTYAKTCLFENVLAVFNKGTIDFSSTVEEIYINLCEAKQYDADGAGYEIFEQTKADVRTAFHTINNELVYRTTTNEQLINRAFLSSNGVENLLKKVVGALVQSANYDEFLVMKYLLAKCIFNGQVSIKPISAIVDEATAKQALIDFKALSNDWLFPSTEYNMSGVYATSTKDNQYILMTNKADANVGVNALAYMFGPEYANNSAKKITIDSFSKLEMNRLRKVLGIVDGASDPLTSDELSALDNIQAVLLDREWFQIYYNSIRTTVTFDEEHLRYNNRLFLFKTFSTSPFANICVFASGTNGVSSVAIKSASVPTITHGVGGSAQIETTVSLTGLTPMHGGAVKYALTGTGADDASISSDGVLSWKSTLTAGKTIIVTATSLVDSTKSDSKTITVA